MDLNKPDQQVNPYAVGNAPVAAPNQYPTLVNDKPWSPKGRFSRLSYLAWVMLLAFVVTPIAFVIIFSAGGLSLLADPSGLFSFGTLLLIVPLYIALMAISIIFMIRRLHDSGRSGWWSALVILPGINLLLLLYVYFMPGTPGVNQFGPPRQTRGWEKVLGWLFVAMMVLGIAAAVIVPSMMTPALPDSEVTQYQLPDQSGTGIETTTTETVAP